MARCVILTRMNAVVVERHGPPGVLALREVADPEPAEDEVRIRVRAVALNRADLLQRRGLYPAPPGVPSSIPGLEFAGEVEARGARAGALELGERVMGLVAGGAYAEKLCVHPGLCMRLPAGLDWAQAAAIPEAFATAYDALFRILGVRRGDAVLVNPAGSGVGTAAVQLARELGARVIAVSRTARKRERLLELGAHAAPDPAAAQTTAEIRRGGGVDTIVDMVGAAAWPFYLDVLRERGRVVVVGLLGGARLEVDLARWMKLRLTVAATVLRGRPLDEKVELVAALGRHLAPRLESGDLRPVVDRCFDIAQAAEAHAYMETNANFGKIVLTIGGAAT